MIIVLVVVLVVVLGPNSKDRGRSKGLNLAPPSEPYGRFSRIRLSGQWVSW
jgi:hypothetical protein